MDKMHVYVAISAYGDCCCFGVRSAAEAWAGEHGSVDEVELREPPQLQVVAARPSTQERGEALFYYRPRSDGLYEGPIHRSVIEPVRRNSEQWVPLYPPPAPSGRVAELEAELAHVTALHRNAAQTLDGVLQTRRSVESELAEIAAALPGPAYMDPPDGGSVSIAEQVRRMADDVEATRKQLAESREREGRMREALRLSRQCLQDANEAENSPIRDTIWFSKWETLFDYMDAALAADKGN